MKDFGKLNFSTAFRPTSAFPLDARCVFADLASAEVAAATAEEVGSKNTIYYYGMRLLVTNDTGDYWYEIMRDKTLRPLDSVLLAPQTLTPEKKAQARQNIGAMPSDYTPPNQTAEQVGADPKGTAAAAVKTHNEDDTAHSDIRTLLKNTVDRINAVLDSDEETLDELSEIVAYIKSNKTLIDAITISKVNVSDIANDLKTNDTKKVLSAAQGVALKRLVDDLSPAATAAILFVAQELDAEKQAQARGNIGAAQAVAIAQGVPEIQPNVFYDFGEVSSLEIILTEPPDDGLAYEYAFEFVAKSDFTEMKITPDPKWASDPSIFKGKTHQVSILRGVGVMVSA